MSLEIPIYGCKGRSSIIFNLYTLLLLLAIAPAESAPLVKAVKFTQSHYFTGPNQLYVAKDAIRLENVGQMRFIVVAKAPDWGVTIFRNDDKSYFSESLKQFEDTGMLSDYLVGKKGRRFDSKPNCRKSTFSFSGFNIVRLTSMQETFKYLPLDQVLNAAPQVESVLFAAYKMPTCGGIPVNYVGIHYDKDFLSGVNERGARQLYFDTTKIENVMVPASMFEMPAGYHKAVSIREVVSGEGSRLESELMVPAFDRKEGKKDKPDK